MTRFLMFPRGLFGGVLAMTLAFPAAAAAQLVPNFDWSVPDRYTADGMAGVRLPVEETPETLRILNPEAVVNGVAAAGWPADFTACASTGPIVKYTWTVDGKRATASSDCRARIKFPREGRYSVKLTIENAGGGKASTTQEVTIQDWLIVAVGDSYGSGEGVPNVPVAREGLVNFEVAQAAWAEASANAEEALEGVTAARAAVEAAKRNLDEARADLDGLYDAWNRLLSAQQALASANAAVTAANTALAKATAAVVSATANVAFECAQLWDPAGCTAAKAKLAKAQQTQAAAIAKRDQAVAKRNAAQLALAQALLAVPAEGFEYMSGVLSARVSLMLSRFDVAAAALQAAVQFAASAGEILDAALAALHERAGSASPLWQDSIAMPGRIVLSEMPFYEPNSYSQCHQSKFSGQALAALKLEQEDPKTSVTFVHLSCSGATITKGLLGTYGGIEPPRPGSGTPVRPAQINHAADLTQGREVDALVTSIGGNDIGFASLIEECMTTEPCFLPTGQISDAQIESACQSFDSANDPIGAVRLSVCKAALKAAREKNAGSNVDEQFRNNLAGLAGKYADLHARIRQLWPALPSSRIFLTEYPMMTRDQNNDICGFFGDPGRNLPGISGPEYLWAEQVAATMLNQTIADQQHLLGWTVVKGVAEAFRRHGYCSSSSWIVSVQESLDNQVGLTGTAHPNAAGQQAYAASISAALRKAFYPATERIPGGAPR